MCLLRLAVFFVLVTASVSAQSAKPAAMKDALPSAPKPVHSFDLSSLDTTADPCTNFYQYACGNWRRNNPIPSDQPAWVSFLVVDQSNLYLEYKELKSAADSPHTALQKQYGGYFAACMDTDAIDGRGIRPVGPSLEAIAALGSKEGIAGLIADPRFAVAGFAGLDAEPDQKDATHWMASVYQGGLTLPDRDYYLTADDHMKEIRNKFQAYIVKLMTLAGDSPALAQTTAADVLRIETALAQASMPREDMRDPDNIYHPMPVAALAALTPAYRWTELFEKERAPSFSRVNVGQPEFFKKMNALIVSEPLPALKNYLRFQTLDNAATALPAAFDQAHFEFHDRVLSGQETQKARWKRCTGSTDAALGEAVGQDWVRQNFPPEAKRSMELLVANLRGSLKEDIAGLPWMSEPTKKEAELKLSQFRQKIGYPDKWRDYTGIVVEPGDWFGDRLRANVFNNAFYLNHIGKVVDESEWGMTPPTVNAYYNASMNDINFPAGILQPPFYQLGIDAPVNYGSIGAIIGHEMTHGFDDEGSRFDGLGNKRNWFTEQDKRNFDQRTDCEVKEYGSFEPVAGQKLNGKLTLGENTADNGGIRIAYQALRMAMLSESEAERTRKIDGYTPEQRFFIAFAQVWCENSTPDYQRMMIKVDPHSPGEFRTNGVVQNFDQFGKAFGCHMGQPMMPVNACHVW